MTQIAPQKIHPTLLAALDRFAAGSGGRLRSATEILAGARGDPLNDFERNWFRGAIPWWNRDLD